MERERVKRLALMNKVNLKKSILVGSQLGPLLASIGFVEKQRSIKPIRERRFLLWIERGLFRVEGSKSPRFSIRLSLMKVGLLLEKFNEWNRVSNQWTSICQTWAIDRSERFLILEFQQHSDRSPNCSSLMGRWLHHQRSKVISYL